MKRHYLPDKYASVPAVTLTTTAIAVARCNVRPVQTCLDKARAEENSWVEYSLPLVRKEELASEDDIVWAACHASLQPTMEDPSALCALLPLFYEKSATHAVIKHGMYVQKKAIAYLNPGQIPVTTTTTSVCPGKVCTMEIASHSQWESACGYSGWPAHRYGSVEHSGRTQQQVQRERLRWLLSGAGCSQDQS